MSENIYSIGIQNFEKLRKGRYFYADKTTLVYKMLKMGNYYFLNNPRRFGKSLLIFTPEIRNNVKSGIKLGYKDVGFNEKFHTFPYLLAFLLIKIHLGQE